MDWHAAARSLTDEKFTVYVTVGFALTVAIMASVLGMALGFVMGWRHARRECQGQIETMQRSVLRFDAKCKRLEAAMTREQVDEAVSYLDERGG